MTTFLTQRAMELEGVAFCFANSLQLESKVYGDLWNCMETGTDANPRSRRCARLTNDQTLETQ
jgi:hypothetical protein